MELSQLPDATLVQHYRRGNEYALEVLIKRHQAKIFGFIFSKLDDVELTNDIFQDTFIKVINTLKTGKYNEEGKFISWVMRIAHNLIMDHYRREKRTVIHNDTEQTPFFSFLKDDSETVEELLIQNQITEDLQQLILELPEDQQEVIRMRLYQDLSFKEIAEATDVSINTALGRMRYAIINLRRMLEKKQISLSI
ncbi:sigma-70 family RNA polymerase sigma factor [Myroides sp. DF42-4-2]|uniref:sigma-70 family RNA polymerase sigma factor n=1 Tax=unclassified Myroides TaxID=2642485 RepID=UPI0025761236|nr:sigma-70 family RNA polymerase sigma factor [Myroides sp. DF42-4-2]MDM1407482.1 sigma-70 family RNA polymerase sigma factor [Myroides sp. DF42-4-2]